MLSFRKSLSLIAALIAVTGLNAARADYIEPGAVTAKTVKYTPAYDSLPQGLYEYSVTWAAIPVATATIEVKEERRQSTDLIAVSALARSSRLVRLFYSLNHLSESVIERDTLLPVVYHYIQKENSKLRSVEIAYTPGKDTNEIKAKLWKNKEMELYEQRDFKTESFVLDPLSAGYIARLAPAAIGQDYTFDVFNGKHRFLITLHVEGKEKIKIAGVEREAFKVTPMVKKLSDSDGEKRLRSATIWVSADERRDILKLKSEVFFGAISAELVRFLPRPPAEMSTARASLAPPTEQDLTRSVEALTAYTKP